MQAQCFLVVIRVQAAAAFIVYQGRVNATAAVWVYLQLSGGLREGMEEA